MLCVTQVFAQNRTITGTVTAKEDGLPIPGVTVKIKGTALGVSTDANGKYTVSASTGSTLVFSFIAYLTQEVPVGSQSTINVVLSQNTKQLSEVVVTALGVSREKKSLGYAQTTVKNEVINASSPVGLFGGLQGKVAGVSISNMSGSPGGSTKVILRGYSSFTGTNQPLYVVDGVPFDNGRAASSNSFDFGNNGNDIDPNIIDNLSILKGAAATAIYGSRGSNGVILITTKKGRSGPPVIEFNAGFKMSDVAITFKPQEEFGQGWGGDFILSENGSWGPKYDGVLRPWGPTGSGTGATIGKSQLLKPYSFIKNNVLDAFDKGIEMNNSLSIRGGSDVSQYIMSYSNATSDGFLPGNRDVFKRNEFNLTGSTNYKNLSIVASLNYVNKVNNTMATGQSSVDGSTFYEDLLQIPADIPIKDLRDYKNIYFNVDNYFTPFAENPYYDLYENGARQTLNRVFGNINLNYKVTNWFTLNFQQSADVSSSYTKIWNNKNAPSPGSWNAGRNVEGAARAADLGSDLEQNNNNFEYDTKLQGLFVKKFNSTFDINAVAGVNYNDRASHALQAFVENLTIPGFFQINNSSNKPTAADAESHQRLVGFYGQATLGFKDYLYLTVTGRNDITSTLSAGKNSYFYPGANLSYIISQGLDLSGSVLTYAKLRGGYGETGSSPGAYSTYNTVTSAGVPLGFGSITFPLNGVSGYTVSNTLNNPGLKPERVKELEVGGEFKFLDSRIGLEVTYYNHVRQDQILATPIAPSTGYTAMFVNFGKTRNRGIELTFSATPVKSPSVQWDLNYTFSRDRSLVLALAPGIEKFLLNSLYDAQLVAVVGQPLGIIQAPTAALDPNGHIIVDGSGYPTPSATNATYGHVAPDFRMGLSNSLKVKNFTLGFTLDYSQGGVFYSGTADLMNFVGNAIETTYNDRNTFIVPNSVQAVTSGSTTTYVENTTPVATGNITNMYYPTTNKGTSYNQRILTKTYVKLREVTFSYTLSKKVANSLGAKSAVIGVFGNNLYTWLPSSNHSVDPEMSNLGSDLASEFGEFRTGPPLRYFGANLKVSF